ncbi:MAG: electron transfer flavoprotein subunit alpha/FixB family protein, partial [Candidatus Dadabacteria bacterium]|nr:electron transfer flavoprotein subunit alpha/FixB family protein [Candidatus Dadabacteria bacterium]
MSSEIWVVADIKADGQIRKVTFEVLSEARRKLAGSVCAVLLGSGVSDRASELASYGAEKVYVVDNPNLKDFNPDGYVKALCELIKKHSPAVVLSGNTAFAEDYMPRVASGVGSGLAMDCVD